MYISSVWAGRCDGDFLRYLTVSAGTAFAHAACNLVHSTAMTRAKIIVNDYYHPAKTMTALLEPLQRSSSYTLTISDAPTDGDTGDLEGYGLLVLGAMGQLEPQSSTERWLTPQGEERIAEFVAKGGGFLVLHSALAGYPPVGPLRSVVRGHFTSHPKDHPRITVTPVVTDHPITADIDAFSIVDEQYFVEVDRDDTTILAEGESAEHGGAPAVWVHEIGQGRVCVITPGHTEEVARHRTMQRIVINAVDWLVHKT